MILSGFWWLTGGKSRSIKTADRGKSNVHNEKRVHGKGVNLLARETNKMHVTDMRTLVKVASEPSRTSVDWSVQTNSQALQVSAVKPNNVVKGGHFMFTSKQALKLKKNSPPKGHTKRAHLASLNTSPVQ